MSFKKCGSHNCEICKPLRLNNQDFKSLDHLPDPTPGTNDHYYEQFSEVFGTDTTEEAMPSLKTFNDCGHIILFNPIKHHASNKGLIVDCVECTLLVHGTSTLPKSWQKVKSSYLILWYPTWSTIVDPCWLNSKTLQIIQLTLWYLRQVFVRSNNLCQTCGVAILHMQLHWLLLSLCFKTAIDITNKQVSDVYTLQSTKKHASSIEAQKKKGANIMNLMILFLFLFLGSLYFSWKLYLSFLSSCFLNKWFDISNAFLYSKEAHILMYYVWTSLKKKQHSGNKSSAWVSSMLQCRLNISFSVYNKLVKKNID